MHRNSRKINVEQQIGRLERRHSELAARVERLDSGMYLTAEEQRRVTDLKKAKLAAKDALMALRSGR
ncbi:MAG: DUF465 domain-containing protein [Myxococcales bacterium]|nr:DUF465 domain-containing protein [Myxococcales bacterium]